MSLEPNPAQNWKQVAKRALRANEKQSSFLPQDMEVTAEELEYVLNAVLSKSKCQPRPPIREPRAPLEGTCDL